MRKRVRHIGRSALIIVITGFLAACHQPSQETTPVEEVRQVGFSENRNVIANNGFFYYSDLEGASSFYTETLGLETIADYGFAKILRIAPTSYVTLVDGARGMHSWTEEKAVMISLLTTDIDGWFAHLSEEEGFTMRDDEIGVESRAGARVFVGRDPDGYIIEFDEFFEMEGNEILLETLAASK